MSTTKHEWLNGKTLLVAIVSALVMYFFVTSIQQSRLYELELLTREQIAKQETTLVAIAEITARNGADAITESIVRDCSLTERQSFDNLLSRLDAGLSRTELVELERLFGRCGNFFAERKSVMVARLGREIGVYESFIEQASVVAGEDVGEDYQLAAWQSLVELEEQQSELFTELVSLQDDIITALLGQSPEGSGSLEDIQSSAREVRENLAFTNQQASEVRATLLGL